MFTQEHLVIYITNLELYTEKKLDVHITCGNSYVQNCI